MPCGPLYDGSISTVTQHLMLIALHPATSIAEEMAA